jgi:hypothetical protein
LQHDRRAGLLHAVEEALDQRALAHAGRGAHEHDTRRAVDGDVERALQLADLCFSPVQRWIDVDVAAGPRQPALTAERFEDLVAVGALVRIAREQAHAQRVEVARHLGHQLRGRARIGALLVAQHVHVRALERHLAGQGFVEHRAERVEVGAFVDALAARLLGRHVRGRSHHARFHRAMRVWMQLEGDAEVEHDRAAVARHQHVVGLQVAMELAGGVHREQALGDLPEHVAQRVMIFERAREEHFHAARARPGLRLAAALLGAARAVHRVLLPAPGPEQVAQEVFALHVLHREEPLAAGAEQLVELHEVLVADVGQGAELALEPVDAGRVDAAQRLERDARLALAIERQVHRAHAAFAQLALDHEPICAERASVGQTGTGGTAHGPGHPTRTAPQLSRYAGVRTGTPGAFCSRRAAACVAVVMRAAALPRRSE